ncbi:MAG: MiaB/RimO family radical SAM methylthiotransferase, partial [Bacteroidales bacterium]|nr:MiaB/RimO family radical SAM methylthiotransferase [Bacteroidales bacterium]
RLAEIVSGQHKDTCTKRANDDGRWEFSPAWSSGDRTRAFLKIQDGCDYFCTYCAIPLARGRSRSATIDEVVTMAHECAATGAKEIVLTGVNTGTFGMHTGEQFIELLRRLDEIEAIERYRISSIEPNLITDEIIEFTAQSRAFLPHFHIPLQAGSDNVLRLMHRHYDTALYRDKVEHIKSLMPDACIAADIIAGFNGESDEDFDETKRFVESLPLSYLHVFTYSERPHTAALKLTPRTDMHIRRQRSQELHTISERKMAAFVESQLGKRRAVLWESSRLAGEMYGLTDNYVRVRQKYAPELSNTVTEVVLSKENIVVGTPTD